MDQSLSDIERGKERLFFNFIVQLAFTCCTRQSISSSSDIRLSLSETYFLIARFLEDGPCQEAANVCIFLIFAWFSMSVFDLS